MRSSRRAVGAVGVLAALAVVAGCAGSTDSGGSSRSDGRSSSLASSSPPVSASPTTHGDAAIDRVPGLMRAGLSCGQPFHRPSGPQLVVSGRFPASVAAGTQSLAGQVAVSAPQASVAGVVAPAGDVFLVRDGQIVALPMVQDSVGVPLRLQSGESRDFPAPARLRDCAGSPPDSLLPRGEYDVYVRVVVNRDDGTRFDSFGGPWPLQVR